MFIFCYQDLVSDFSGNSDMSAATSEQPALNKISPKKRKSTLKTTNAYFYWVTREQGSFDWFKGVMNEVAELDQRVMQNVQNFNLFPFYLNIYDIPMMFRGSSRCITT